MHIVKPAIKLIWVTPNALSIIEKSGRTCYKSENKITKQSAEKFVSRIIKMGHESVLEHAVASFRIICDRGVSHELVRHRLAAYSQESTRYCDYSSKKFNCGLSIIHPKGLSKNQIKQREILLKQIETLYNAEISEGVKPQISRGILPHCLKTEIVCTMNFREWRLVLKARTSEAAHPQIDEVMQMILNWFRKKYPVIVEDLTEKIKS